MSALAAAPVVPGGWPLAGHLPALLRERLDFLPSLGAYGDVVAVRLGPKRAYVVTAPEVLHELLVTHAAKFDKGRIFEKARRFVGNGLATAETEGHRVHRQMLQPAFHQQRIAGYAETMRQMAEEAVAAWEPGAVIDLGLEMDTLVTSVVAKVLFSAELAEAAIAEVHRSFPVVVEGLAVRSLLPAGLEWALPDRRRYDAAVRRLRHVIAEIIARYRADGADHGDLLSMIIAAQDEQTGARMDDEQVHDEVMTFLLGGINTSAAALAWIFWELHQHPEVERQLHEEVDAVLDGQPPRLDDVRRLEHVNRVVAEVLRLYASTLLMRRVREPVVLGGVAMPVGTEVIYTPYGLHRDPRWFPDPDRFDPDRWLPERAAEIPRYAYLPFGSGPRVCIANAFAKTELAIDVAVIASRWRLRPLPGQQVHPIARAAVHPSRLLVSCEPRV
jgi:cytochrome P450